MSDFKIPSTLLGDKGFKMFLRDKYLTETINLPSAYKLENGPTLFFYVQDNWIYCKLSENAQESKKFISLDFFINKVEREKIKLQRDLRKKEEEEDESFEVIVDFEDSKND